MSTTPTPDATPKVTTRKPTPKPTPRGAGRQGNRTKSQWVRDLLDEGKTIAEITRIVPNMGYAFAYGIAKRAGKAMTAADRRPQRAVSVEGTVVKVVLADGRIGRVDRATGKYKISAK